MLVNTATIIAEANRGNYAVVAANIISELDARGYIEVAERKKSPLILEIAIPTILSDMQDLTQNVSKMAKAASVPIAIHLDHGANIGEIMLAVRSGVTSVMLDCSSLPFEENAANVKRVVDMVSLLGISVEAELGHVGQGSDYDSSRGLTDPEEALRFIEITGIDCLAVAIGTAHGSYSGIPRIDFNRLTEIKRVTGNFPLVLHGSSGSGEDNIRKACSMGINKVNVFNDLMKSAVKNVQASDLEGNGAYHLLRVVKEGAQMQLAKMIDIAGSSYRV